MSLTSWRTCPHGPCWTAYTSRKWLELFQLLELTGCSAFRALYAFAAQIPFSLMEVTAVAICPLSIATTRACSAPLIRPFNGHYDMTRGNCCNLLYTILYLWICCQT
jgi:hypothetical protein